MGASPYSGRCQAQPDGGVPPLIAGGVTVYRDGGVPPLIAGGVTVFRDGGVV